MNKKTKKQFIKNLFKNAVEMNPPSIVRFDNQDYRLAKNGTSEYRYVGLDDSEILISIKDLEELA